MAQLQCPQCYNYEIIVYKPKPLLILAFGRVERPVGLIVALIVVDMLLTLPLVRAIQSRKHFPNGAVYHCESCGHQWTENAPVTVSENENAAQNFSGFQMTIEDVFFIKGRGTVVTGRVESRTVHVGDAIALLGSSGITQTVVDSIEQFQRTKQSAEAGENVGIFLRGVRQNAVQRGDVLRGGYGSQ